MSAFFKSLRNPLIICLLLTPFICFSSLPVYSGAESSGTIKIASFNIQVFGKTKAGKQDVMDKLAKLILNYDIVAIQEIRDASGTAIKKLELTVDSLGTDYELVIGPRLGRTSSKEQYAFLFKKELFKVIGSYTYDDTAQDIIHREPFIVFFKLKESPFDFVLMNIHTDPDDAGKEISELPNAVSDAKQHFDEPDIIVLGDFNADCSYFRENKISIVFPPEKFKSLITNSEDTTVAASSCTYDRIIITDSAFNDFAEKYGVHRFDTEFGLTNAQAKKISDHYPVWAEFYIDRDED